MKKPEMTPEKFYSSFLKFSGGKIRQAEDLERLITLSYQSGNLETFEELAFLAKYITGLIKIIKSKDNTFDEDYFTKIKDEYGKHIEKIKEKFLIIAGSGTPFIKEIFEKKYFTLTHESLEELNRMCEDLARVKSYLNDLKERGKGF